MPTYVYRFVDTGETIEVQQSFSDPTLTEYAHPGTGQPMAVKKVFQPVGVTFKGSGFFKTDSRNGTKSDKKSDKKSDAASDTSAPSSEKAASGSTTSESSSTSTSSTSTATSASTSAPAAS
jgi:predicted nucleic acid-binding Zn ribbon protein